MRYSQGDEVNTSLSRICTVPTSRVFGSVRLYSFLVPFLLCGYLPWHGHVLPGTKVINESNKDNVCKPTIPAETNRPPPSETISHVIRVPDHKTARPISANSEHPPYIELGLNSTPSALFRV